MNTTNTHNPVASEEPSDAASRTQRAEQAQAYENSLPGTSGNDPAGAKPVDDINVSRTMMQTAQTDAERGSPGLSPEEAAKMKR